LRAIQKGACADLTCRLDDHASSIRRCAFTPSDRLITCDATGNLRVWHWERRGEVLPSPPSQSPMALGTDDAFCKDQSQLGWDDMGDPAVSAYLPEHRGCSMKLDVVAGAVWCRSGEYLVEAAPNGVVARVAGDPTVEPVALDAASALCCASYKELVAFGFADAVRCWSRSETGWSSVECDSMDEPCTALALNATHIFSAHGDKVAAYDLQGETSTTAQETRQVLELAAFADRPACAARLQDGSACVFEVEDGALEETLLVAVADALSITTWRDAAVALDKNGAVSFHRGAADPCYEVVSVGGGAASIKCGPTDLLVAYADSIKIWAMAVDDSLGKVLLTPKASLQLDAAPARVEAAASATLGLVATAQGALWYFHADAAHDDEFGDEA